MNLSIEKFCCWNVEERAALKLVAAQQNELQAVELSRRSLQRPFYLDGDRKIKKII
ncbi:MAG: hypothetical protein JRI61_02960 [Deltaproteobacteria bacterium]|nr:hypothetical protein [Deltaproteobacteria bacterium]